MCQSHRFMCQANLLADVHRSLPGLIHEHDFPDSRAGGGDVERFRLLAGYFGYILALHDATDAKLFWWLRLLVEMRRPDLDILGRGIKWGAKKVPTQQKRAGKHREERQEATHDESSEVEKATIL